MVMAVIYRYRQTTNKRDYKMKEKYLIVKHLKNKIQILKNTESRLPIKGSIDDAFCILIKRIQINALEELLDEVED